MLRIGERCGRVRRTTRQMAFVVFAVLAGTAGAAAQPDDLADRTPDELKQGIENAHPATYYVLAVKLFEEGKQDEAVFWFYCGQLRYRFHLTASPGLDPSGDPALFGSFSEVIGRPINEYAFGDLVGLPRTIDEVLAWDERTPNGFTSKEAHEAAWREIRTGLEGLRVYIVENADAIRAQRTANGLTNRE